MDASNARVERLRRVNRYKAVQAELAREREEAEFNLMRERKLAAAARDEALAKELAEEQRLKLKEEKMIQFVRDLPELRNLEAQLKHARMRQDRAEQVEENKKMREQRLQEERDHIAYLDEQDRLAKLKDDERRQRDIQAFHQHQAAQLSIIEERRAKNEREAEARRRERIAVDAVVARVQEKEFLNALERHEKQRQLQAEQEEFVRLRKEVMEAERQRQLREDAAIEAYHAEQGRRKETDEKLMREKEAIKARILEEQSRKMAEERAKRDELESLLNNYYEAERIAKERQAIKDEKEKRDRLAEEVKQENWKLIQERRRLKEQERAEDAMLRQKAMEALALKEKMDKLEKEKQIQLKKEEMKETEKRLERFRELKREEERQAALVQEQERRREAELKEYIRRAREQLLAQYIPSLGAFAPSHVLTAEEKKQYVTYAEMIRYNILLLRGKRQPAEKVWKAVPLPQQFHTSLETGDWMKALHVYQRHPYHAPPVDTFDLLKAVMHATGVGVDDVKSRFNEKIRLSAILQRKAPDEVEWAVFWEALNNGDSKTISAALMGARLSSVSQQVATAEACAVLLKFAGNNWEEKLVDSFPFATVTRCNLVHVALAQKRWDVAVELLRTVRVTRSDVVTLWPLIKELDWEKALMLISACPKNSVPFDLALTHILRGGCSLQQLSEHLENARVLGDVDVVAPLLSHAVEVGDWDYVGRGMEHLVDIGQITQPAREVFDHMLKIHGAEKVCKRLLENRIPLHRITVEMLESLKL